MLQLWGSPWINNSRQVRKMKYQPKLGMFLCFIMFSRKKNRNVVKKKFLHHRSSAKWRYYLLIILSSSKIRKSDTRNCTKTTSPWNIILSSWKKKWLPLYLKISPIKYNLNARNHFSINKDQSSNLVEATSLWWGAILLFHHAVPIVESLQIWFHFNFGIAGVCQEYHNYLACKGPWNSCCFDWTKGEMWGVTETIFNFLTFLSKNRNYKCLFSKRNEKVSIMSCFTNEISFSLVSYTCTKWLLKL